MIELPRFLAVLLLGAVPSLVRSFPPTATPPALVRDTTPSTSPSTQRQFLDLPTVGKPAPQLAVQQWLNPPAGKTLGKTTTFGDGHVYILDFTATWCGSCAGMYPKLDSLQRRYGARGLRVLYVTAIWDSNYTTESPTQQLRNLSRYIAAHHLSQPVAVIANPDRFVKSGYFPYMNGYYQADLPATFLIDGTGTLQAIWGLQEAPFYHAVDVAVTASHSKAP